MLFQGRDKKQVNGTEIVIFWINLFNSPKRKVEREKLHSSLLMVTWKKRFPKNKLFVKK